MNCNLATVELESIEGDEEQAEVKELIQLHYDYTGSAVAKQALEDWTTFVAQCVKVMPRDYKRVLQEMKAQTAASAS